jgi:NAD(P)H dehydrogenase (quinone)
MIIVTGATGKLGSQIVRHLLERVPADQVGVSVRDPAKAAALTARGVRVRAGDYTDPGSLARAFEGASQVLVVSASSTGAEALAQHRSAIDAARDAGAERVLYTSHQASAAGSLFAPMPDHAATEQYLAGLGISSTSLRNGFYASTVPQLLGPALQTGEIIAPADGPVSWTTHADLAEAAAIILAGGGFDGPTPALTAAAAVDLADVAAVLSELTGRTIRRVVADDQEWVAGLLGHGVPEPVAQMLLGLFRASREGEFATVDPALGKLLGREPQSIRTVLTPLISTGTQPI